MNEILNNFLNLFTGMLGGLFLGWSLKTMHYARQVRDSTKDIRHKMDDVKVLVTPSIPEQRNKRRVRNEHGWYKHGFSLVLVLIITAGAAFWTGAVNLQLHHSQTCTEQAVSKLTSALNERTNLSTRLSLADSEQNKAFSLLVVALLAKPPADQQTSYRLFASYSKKLDRYLRLQDSQRVSQREHPFPKDATYRECLDGKE